MITFFTGVPGSGKTYYAVDKIYNNFSNDEEAVRDKKATYDICYTNINEFNFNKVENVYKLDFDDLKEKLTELHKLYKAKVSDEDLIEKCKEYNLYNALFVIDEAHNYFDVKDVVLIWWLSYHRHLFHEIILITQNLSLIESKYKSFSEFFYNAFAQSLTLFKTHFKYNVFCSSRLSQKSKTGTVKIKRNKKVFELYKSGDSINAQNVILKFLLIALFLFVLVFFIFYLIKRSYTSDSVSSNDDFVNNATSPVVLNSSVPTPIYSQDNNIKYAPVDNYNNHSSDYESSHFLVLSCNASICYNEDIQLPVPLVTYFIKNDDLSLLYTNNINDNYLKLYLSASQSFYKFLISTQGNKENAKKPNTNSMFNSFSSPVPQSR